MSRVVKQPPNRILGDLTSERVRSGVAFWQHFCRDMQQFLHIRIDDAFIVQYRLHNVIEGD